MNKINKKILYILATFSLICSLFTIRETYAKYITTATGNANLTIARWKIIVNNQKILSNTSITNTINPIFIENENTNDGVIAPRSEGYFDIIIDTTDVDVSYEYTVNISNSEDSIIKDLIITGYEINGNPKVEINNKSTTIKNIVQKNSENKIINLRVHIMWDDSENASMNNAEDTLASLSGENANLDVTLSFVQVAS